MCYFYHEYHKRLDQNKGQSISEIDSEFTRSEIKASFGNSPYSRRFMKFLPQRCSELLRDGFQQPHISLIRT